MKKKGPAHFAWTRRWAAVAAALSMVVHCTGLVHADAALVEEVRPLLHTFVEIKVWGKQARDALEKAFAEMERVNNLLNNYDSDSEVSAINRQAGGTPVRISPETMEALQRAGEFGRLTGGAFDVTVGPLLELWGFDREVPGLEGGEPGDEALQEVKSLVDYRALALRADKKKSPPVYTAHLKKKGMRIDVGALSKGYVADRAAAVLRRQGICNALIAAGGTIRAIGTKPGGAPWQVAVRHPRKNDTFLTVIALSNASVSTSGDYERYYTHKGKRRTHIIDPRTGVPVDQVQAVTVIAEDGVTSDALATALFVLGLQDGIALVDSITGVEALMVTSRGDVVYSEKWPKKTIIY